MVSILILWVPLVEQEQRTLPKHLSSSTVFSGVRVTRVLVLCVCFIDRCLSFNTFFFWPLCCLFFAIEILIAPLVSSNSSYCVICLLLHRVMSNILLFCVVIFLLFFFVLCLVYPMLQFSLDCSFLIALYLFSLSFIHESTNVALESTHIYITIGKGGIR